jgi:phospholipid transport system substrate-binding protein
MGVKMKFFLKTIMVITLIWWCLALRPAIAGEATAQLSTTIDEFVAILSNTSVDELRTTGLPEKARNLIFSRFDFSEMTKRALGRHWQSLDQAEQREFVDALTRRLLVSYGKTVRASGHEKIEYKRELQDGSNATVQTIVISENGDNLPIDYQLHEVNGQWQVYDMKIDQVSLVNNFRAQFERVIAKSSVKDLLRKVKEENS